MARQDYKLLKKNLVKTAKRAFKNHSAKSIQKIVGTELLQYGPNELIGEGVKPGYVIVDTVGIEENVESDMRAIAAEQAHQKEKVAAFHDKMERRRRMNQPGFLGAIKGFFERNFGDPRNLSGE
jgi:hypothetical protein